MWTSLAPSQTFSHDSALLRLGFIPILDGEDAVHTRKGIGEICAKAGMDPGDLDAVLPGPTVATCSSAGCLARRQAMD